MFITVTWTAALVANFFCMPGKESSQTKTFYQSEEWIPIKILSMYWIPRSFILLIYYLLTEKVKIMVFLLLLRALVLIVKSMTT